MVKNIQFLELAKSYLLQLRNIIHGGDNFFHICLLLYYSCHDVAETCSHPCDSWSYARVRYVFLGDLFCWTCRAEEI